MQRLGNRWHRRRSAASAADSASVVVELMRRVRVPLLLGCDVSAVVVSYALFATLRYEFSTGEPPWGWVFGLAGVALATHFLIGLAVKLYRGRVPVASVDETLLLSISAAGAAVVAQMVNVASNTVHVGRTVPLGAGFMALALMVAARAWWRTLSYRRTYVGHADRRRTVIVGAGAAGAQLVRSLRTIESSPFEPVALLDDDPWKRHLRLDGVPVRGRVADVAVVAEECGAEVVIVAIMAATSELLAEISQHAASANLEVKVLPSVAEMFSNQLSIRDVRDIDIADILGRSAIDTDLESVGHLLEGKRVLVTGAGGSIGSELSRQIHRCNPAELMLLDRDESALHAVQLALYGHGLLDSNEVLLADIRDSGAVMRLFSERRPQVVFHAAALKHLPMLEQYPLEGLKTNVMGTLHVLEAAHRAGVERFVNISTDKAADPTSVLGYTKRVAERLTAGYARLSTGEFLSVRFGNVLGSRGSVLTSWAAQIARGGPVTVTHPDVTRYFMTIHEACQLVLRAASALGADGRALILDMGQPIRIDDVARQLIAQSGQRIEVVYTGLRPGEKLHEVLIAEAESGRGLQRELITHVHVPPLAPGEVWETDPELEAQAARELLRRWCEVPAHFVDGERTSA